MDTMRDRFAPVVSRLLDEDPRVAVVLAEIGKDGFADAQLRHPERVINVGIREQLLVGAGAGLALTGMRPIVHTFASFLVEQPGYDRGEPVTHGVHGEPLSMCR